MSYLISKRVGLWTRGSQTVDRSLPLKCSHFLVSIKIYMPPQYIQYLSGWMKFWNQPTSAKPSPRLRICVHSMWCCGVWHVGTNILVKPGISIFRVRRKELLYPEEGGSRFLQIVWVYLPNLMESHPTTLSSTNWSPHYISHAQV